jgi:hypothetical protein
MATEAPDVERGHRFNGCCQQPDGARRRRSIHRGGCFASSHSAHSPIPLDSTWPRHAPAGSLAAAHPGSARRIRPEPFCRRPAATSLDQSWCGEGTIEPVAGKALSNDLVRGKEVGIEGVIVAISDLNLGLIRSDLSLLGRRNRPQGRLRATTGTGVDGMFRPG